VDGVVGGTRSEDRYLTEYPPATSSVSSSSSQSPFEASVWQQYRYYHNQFYRHHQYLPQYPQYPGAGDAGTVEHPTYHHASAWLHSHQYQHPQSQLHLADGVGITPGYHQFREMNGICSYDSVY